MVVGLGCSASAPHEAPPVSVLIVVVDTLRADHLGTYGYPIPTSPNVDALAAGGAKFTRAYAAAPWTYSSVASLFTGLLPAAHGAVLPGLVKNEAKDPVVVPLGADFSTMAERFAAAGFQTALFARNGYLGHGNEQGFATYENPKRSRAADQAKRAVAWLETVPTATPFLLAVHMMDVHVPNRPTSASRALFPAIAALADEERDRVERFRVRFGGADDPAGAMFRTRRTAMYDASIRDVDTAIGRLLAGLGERRRNTLVVITADHGESLWDHDELERSLYSDPRRLRGVGHGQAFFEEVERVPLIVSLPGAIPPATHSEVVSLVDVLPTLLEQLGLAAAENIDGRSLVPLWKGAALPGRPAVFDSVCFGRDKQGILEFPWKFTRSNAEPDLLVNLDDDPGEHANVASLHPEQAARLAAALDIELARSRARGEGLRSPSVSGVVPALDEHEELKELGYVE
ncbi:hypothetical protein LBMAG42_33010 [Deltaproteobacteria bacterium]|nr:hypothetical protein LBMAG42_33010 [Deltaproteobacteria bacterium]